MKLTPEAERLIGTSLLRLQVKSPFFATLALFVNFQATKIIPTAATDGMQIFVNEEFVFSLSSPELDGLLLHEVLHTALLHVLRRGFREPILWNIAADISVNGMITDLPDIALPVGAIIYQQLDKLSVEEIYDILLKNALFNSINMIDLLEVVPADCLNGHNIRAGGSLERAKQKEIETYWRNALQQAMVVARSQNRGYIPAGIERELGALNGAQIDWRSYLWRYLVQTPTDFSGFDRRFVGRGLYLEALQGETVKVFVAIDTSGSIDDQQLRLFLSEVAGILTSYPHLQCQLYYADADAYGPYDLDPNSKIPPPQGGGGTSFVPFFEKVIENWDNYSTGVCVYLTDGYGEFPPEPPLLPVLWVVTPGGMALENFPFGEAVRLLAAS
ncbi:MAG: VWA-like domain-containing protein [Oscillatoriaceae cyanobacterium]